MKKLPYFLIIGVGLLIYSNSLHGSFQFDDYTFIAGQPENVDLHNIKAVWKDAYPYPTRFITFLTFALNYYFHKFDVFGYHAVNLLLHLINALLIRWLVLLILQTPKLRNSVYATFREKFALIVSLLFLCHPIQTGAVTYIAQRFASLSALFYLAAICFYLSGRLKKREEGKPFFLAGMFSAVLAMFSKENSFTLPFAVILTEATFLTDWKQFQLRKEKYLPALCLIFSFCLIIPLLFSSDFFKLLSLKIGSYSHLGDTISVQNYLLTQFRVLLTYFRLFLFPVNQNLDYDYPVSHSLWEPQTFLSFLVILLIIFTAARAFKKNPLVSYGIFWFFLAAAVESSFIPIRHVIFEHRVYLPSFGFFLAFCAWVFSIGKKPERTAAVFYFLIAIYGILTFERNKVWQSEIALWEDCSKKSPQKSRPHTNLAVAYLNDGQTDLALEHFSRAIELDPKDIQALNGRGAILTDRRQFTAAMEDFDRVLSIEPNSPLVYLNKAKNLAMQGNFEEGFQQINEALKLDPRYPKAYLTKGDIYKSQQKWEEALEAYQTAARLTPHAPEAFYYIGKIYLIKKNPSLALENFTKCLDLDPQHKEARRERNALINAARPE